MFIYIYIYIYNHPINSITTPITSHVPYIAGCTRLASNISNRIICSMFKQKNDLKSALPILLKL